MIMMISVDIIPHRMKRDFFKTYAWSKCFLYSALAVCHYYSNWLHWYCIMHQLMIGANLSSFNLFSYYRNHLSCVLGTCAPSVSIDLFRLLSRICTALPDSRHFFPAMCILEPSILSSPASVLSGLQTRTREGKRKETWRGDSPRWFPEAVNSLALLYGALCWQL